MRGGRHAQHQSSRLPSAPPREVRDHRREEVAEVQFRGAQAARGVLGYRAAVATRHMGAAASQQHHCERHDRQGLSP